MKTLYSIQTLNMDWYIYSECCMSGCAVCVHDLYNESLEEYNDTMRKMRASLTALGVQESNWPDRVRGSGNVSENEKVNGGRKVNPIMSAFDAMERELEEKKRRREGERCIQIRIAN